jgi:ribosomal protein S18 acetylase RimI-like enzyme
LFAAMSDLIVRTTTEADLAAVNRLLVETWHDTYDPLLGAEKVTQITNAWHAIEKLAEQIAAPDSSFLVAEEKGIIVGHAVGHVRPHHAMMLARLYVLPAHQRRGIGVRLLSELVARQPGCARIVADVEQNNVKAVSFYRRQGFIVESESSIEGMKTLRIVKVLA